MPKKTTQPSPWQSHPRYGKLDLRKVTWGYRELFRTWIDDLFEEKILGDHNRHTTEVFFDILLQCDAAFHDAVMKAYLASVTGPGRWILSIPNLFEDWSRLGLRLAEESLHLSVRYFDGLRSGDFGPTPADVSLAIGQLQRLASIDPELVGYFLQGYPTLCQQLEPDEIRTFVQEALRVFANNRQTGLKYIALDLRSSAEYLRVLQHESRISDIQARLERLLRGITGRKVEVGGLSQLDSDDLLYRGAMVVAVASNIYLPDRLRYFEERRRNRAFQMLNAAVAATDIALDGFSNHHGQPGHTTVRQVVENRRIPRAGEAASLVILVEISRITNAIRKRFRGFRKILHEAIHIEFDQRPARAWVERLLHDTLIGYSKDEAIQNAIRFIDETASGSNSFHETVTAVQLAINEILPDQGWWKTHSAELAYGIRALSFFPDHLMPISLSTPPDSALGADLHDAADSETEDGSGEQADSDTSSDSEDGEADTGETGVRESQPDDSTPEDVDRLAASGPRVAYFYDEWSEPENDYYENWCALKEYRPDPSTIDELPGDWHEEARRVRRIFERLKPDEARRIKHLPEGDEIEIDRAIDFRMELRARRSPRIDYYSRPYILHRNLAIALLMDLSGSTGETPATRKRQNAPDEKCTKRVIDLEREAVFVLSEGLQALGDPFGIYGFTGSGREHCEFQVFKNPEEEWDTNCRKRLMAARPGSSTRIGAALRHTAWKLQQFPARTKLILLITDGKPMDSGYDPSTGYAQADVRRACQENLRDGIQTFCISTLENTRADLDRMFPRQRYVVIEDMTYLADTLSKFYLRLTT